MKTCRWLRTEFGRSIHRACAALGLILILKGSAS